MAKDRYSNSHTIEIVGGTETLTIDGDLDVTGTLSASSATITNDLTVSSDIFVTDDVVVGDDLVVGDDASIGGTATIATLVTTVSASRSVAETVCFNFPASAFVPMGDWSNPFTHQVDSAGDGVEVQAGDTLQGSHSLAMLPNGCTIQALRIRYTPQAASGYTVNASIITRGKTFGNVSTLATVSDTSGSDGIFNVASTTGIDETIDTTLFSYWLIYNVNAPGGDTLELHEVNVDCDITAYS